MKTSKIIFLIFFVTVLSLVYVEQQTKIVELTYEKQKKIKLCRALLDRNMLLRYNLISLESSGNLGNSLKASDQYEMLSMAQVIDLRSNAQKQNLAFVSVNPTGAKNINKKAKENILLSLFSLKSQAEAQTK